MAGLVPAIHVFLVLIVVPEMQNGAAGGGAGNGVWAVRSLRLERAYDDGGHEYERRGDHGQMQRSGKCQHLVIPLRFPS